MSYKINRQNQEDLFQPNIVWIFKMAIASLSGLFVAAAIFSSFFFGLLTTGALVVFGLLTAWISTKLRD